MYRPHQLIILPILAILVFSAASCDKGLEPIELIQSDSTVTGVSGTVVFQNWPQPDSLLDIRIVAFKQFPPNDIFGDLFSGQAYAFPEIGDSLRIPLYVDQYEFLFELPADDYDYLVVAQQFGQNVFADWLAVGQYDVDSDSLPSPITIEEGELLENIFISVDFDNLPIQPF